MTIQELLEKVAESGVSLWDLKGYTLVIVDSAGKEKSIKDFTVKEDSKTIRVKLK